jgi:hypothetical protein
MSLPTIQSKNTPAGKGLRTFYQSVIGIIVGLAAVVWAVPGVPEAVQAYLLQNALPLLLLLGVPAGLVSYIQNKKGL